MSIIKKQLKKHIHIELLESENYTETAIDFNSESLMMDAVKCNNK
jgi:hypothetical protein